MTELVARIGSIITNNVIHLNFAYYWSDAIEEQCDRNIELQRYNNSGVSKYGKSKGYNGSCYNMSIPLLNERPGLQNITYSEIKDNYN